MTDLTAIAARLDELESGQARLQQQLQQALQERDELARERDAYKQLYHDMQERCRTLELGLLADRASEKLPRDDNQLTLSIIDMMLSERQQDEIEALAPQKVREHERRKPTGRRPLPELEAGARRRARPSASRRGPVPRSLAKRSALRPLPSPPIPLSTHSGPLSGRRARCQERDSSNGYRTAGHSTAPLVGRRFDDTASVAALSADEGVRRQVGLDTEPSSEMGRLL